MQDQTTELKFDACAEIIASCACSNLRKASRVVTSYFDECLEPSGLKISQFYLLMNIHKLTSTTITHLAQKLSMDQTTMTRNLKILEKQKLIEIVAGQDQRTRVVSLTLEGYNTLTKALPLWKQAQTRVTEGLGQEMWNSLLVGLSSTTSLFESEI